MDVELKLTFVDSDTESTVAYAQAVIAAFRKWRPKTKDFKVWIAGAATGITVVSQK